MKNKFFFLILLFYQAYAQEIPIVTNYDDGRAYTTIAVDNKNRIWAGTDKNGIFILDKEKNQTEFTHQNFPAESNISELTINSMAGDESGNIWVAHSGTQNLYNVYGGVERINTTTLSIQHLSPDRNAQGIPFLENDGIGTRNVQQVIADKNNNIWLAQKYHVMTSDPGTIQPGTFSYRKADAYTEKFKSVGTWKDVKEGKPDLILHFPAYTYKLPISKSHGTRNVTSITANGKYLYVAVEGYEVQDLQGNDKFLGPRILKYHYNGVSPIGAYEITSLGFNANDRASSIYINSADNVWVTNSREDGGLSVLTYDKKDKEDVWYYFNTNLLGVTGGLKFNKNAIWEDPKGRVFFGTNRGFLVYDGVGPVEYLSSYTFYSNQVCQEGKRCVQVPEMLSSNITYGVVEKRDSLSISWVSTDKGIMRVEFPNVKVEVYHIENKGEPHEKEIDGKENYKFLTSMIGKIGETLERAPKFAVDGTTSSIFRVYTDDVQGFYKGNGKNYSWEIRKAEVELPDKPLDLSELEKEEYKDKHGELSFSFNIPDDFDNAEYLDFVYKHPKYVNEKELLPNKNYAEYKFIIWEKDEKEKDHIIFHHPIKFSIPPVLLVHGVWSDTKSLDKVEKFLLDKGFSDLEISKAWRTDSEAAEHPFEVDAHIIPEYIDRLRSKALKDKVSAGKVNVIAHSRGGIYTRAYIENIYTGGGVRRYNNDIHSLITCNTPHAGSQLASLVQDKRIIISEFLVVVGHLSNPFKGLDLVKYESKGPLTIGELFRFPVPKNDRKYNWGAKNLMVVNDEISGSYNPYETNFIEKINSDDNLKEFEKAKVPIHAITTNFSACELHSSLCTGEIMSYLPRKKGKAAIAKAILKVLIKEALPRGVDSFMEYIFKSNDKDKGEKNDFIVPQSSMQAGLGEKYISRFSGKNIMHTDPSFSKIENFILKDLIGVKVSGVMGDSQVHDKIGSLLRQNPNSNTSNFTTKLSPPELTYNFLSGFSGFANKSASFSDLKGKLFINPDSFTELTSGKQTTFDVYQEDLDEMIVACEFPDLDIMYLETRDKGELAYKNSYTVEIPEEAFGKVIITAYGFREGKLEVMHTIEPEVKLPQGVSLQSIRFTEESGSVSEQTTYHYDLLGTFSDGVERRINDMEGIKYTISDTSILEQIDNETVKGLAKGKATLTASINSLKAELILEVVENPVLSSTIVTDFYAECEDDGSVIVKWNTYNEYQTKKFVLERSEDNDQNFVEINQQQAKGISHDPVSYSYTDNPTGKKVFYKLTLYNTEDKILYSQIIEVNREEGGLAVEENLPAGAVKDKNRIYVSPNPLTEASGNLFVHSDSNDAAASLNIYDLTGKLTFTKKYAITQGEQKITFTLPSEISNGVYILQLKTNHFTKSVKLILKR